MQKNLYRKIKHAVHLIAVNNLHIKQIIMKTLLFLPFMMLASLSLFSFKNAPKPKLNPALEKYYDSLSQQPRKAADEIALKNMISYILQSKVSGSKSAIIFTALDNSFTSLSAQIVLQSLLSLNKINNLSVFSCGDVNADISPELITTLVKHGYQVTEESSTGTTKKYTIQFGNNINPLTVFAKQANNADLPKSNFLLIKLCDPETACADIPGFVYKDHLSFNSDKSMSAEDADKLFTSIASEIYYAFNVANHS